MLPVRRHGREYSGAYTPFMSAATCNSIDRLRKPYLHRRSIPQRKGVKSLRIWNKSTGIGQNIRSPTASLTPCVITSIETAPRSPSTGMHRCSFGPKPLDHLTGHFPSDEEHGDLYTSLHHRPLRHTKHCMYGLQSPYHKVDGKWQNRMNWNR